jgi:hypothetical protein
MRRTILRIGTALLGPLLLITMAVEWAGAREVTVSSGGLLCDTAAQVVEVVEGATNDQQSLDAQIAAVNARDGEISCLIVGQVAFVVGDGQGTARTPDGVEVDVREVTVVAVDVDGALTPLVTPLKQYAPIQVASQEERRA